jgi:hypothetical protein
MNSSGGRVAHTACLPSPRQPRHLAARLAEHEIAIEVTRTSLEQKTVNFDQALRGIG